MRSKKRQMMRLTSMAVTARLKDILMKDFSESLSSQIVRHNLYKQKLNLNSVSDGGKAKVIQSIVSDYEAIKPIGSIRVEKLRQDLRRAINIKE